MRDRSEKPTARHERGLVAYSPTLVVTPKMFYKNDPKRTLGFSIKSNLGSPSTLLNAGKTTNFAFKINGIELTKNEIEKINFLTQGAK